ncbi:hypothetical protein [Rhizobium sp. YK2]|uniref:hypothetical protein n=1 Tax=Rhizobium sp. YK2 TaxID=1860096 RepID=UPI00084CC372|nr:hypothetical protein [Rhizobium sp. YK2]OEC93610.1 hypothetical protein A9Z06_09305 [Rhizobium sp. YK2]
MEHDDPKLFVAFDPVKLLLPAVGGLLLVDALLGFSLSVQVKAVLAHPWQNIGYTALILMLYAIVMVLNLCALCAVAIGAISIIWRVIRLGLRVSIVLLKQPIRLVMNGYLAIASMLVPMRKAVTILASACRFIFRQISHHIER